MEVVDITKAMQAILLHHTRGYHLWIGFVAGQDKISALDQKWALELGTHEPAWRRHDRKTRGIPNAVGIAGRVFSQPAQSEVVLMATKNARSVLPHSPYHPYLKQQWREDLPRFSYFEMVHQPTEAQGKLVWTWRIRKPELTAMERHLIQLCDAGEVDFLARETSSMVRNYPMYNGIRSQIRRLLRRIQRKCATKHIAYLGPDPENLPIMNKFPETRRGGAEGALPAPEAH